MQRRFSLFRRGDRGGVYCAQLWNGEIGRYMPVKSTSETSRNAATVVVAGWLRDGWPTGPQAKPRAVADAVALSTIMAHLRSAPVTPDDAGRILEILKERALVDGGVVRAGPGAEPLVDFLERFWTFDESPYVREKLAHGHRIGRRRCYDASVSVKGHWKPYFGGKRLAETTAADLRDFGIALKEKGLAPKSINNILEYGAVALRWAKDNELVPKDPTAGVLRFSGQAKARGVLTPQGAAALFRVTWDDERARVGNLLAMTTGLRAGEVVALQVRDIGEDRLHVRHAWSENDGLKGTKTDTERTVPLIPAVRAELLRLIDADPFGEGDERFVFYSPDPSRPVRVEILLGGLKDALLRMSLTGDDLEDEARVTEARAAWKARGVVFHSWRHYYAARMADRLDARTVMVATGHKTAAMFEHYAEHKLEEQLKQVGAAAAEAFGNVVAFRKEEASQASKEFRTGRKRRSSPRGLQGRVHAVIA